MSMAHAVRPLGTRLTRRRGSRGRAGVVFVVEPLDGVERMAGMKTSKIVALVALAVASWSSAALAEDTAKPAPVARVITVKPVSITGHRQVPLSVDVARVTLKAPLASLKQPLADRIAGAVEKDPF
jgi:hypothetical protein